MIFALDVSGSMDEARAQLAKTFFFFALQGIRRQYAKVETRFIAHAGRGLGIRGEPILPGDRRAAARWPRARSACAGGRAQDALRRRAATTSYFFYASDGENAAEDRAGRAARWASSPRRLNYIGYVETGGIGHLPRRARRSSPSSFARAARRRPAGRQPAASARRRTCGARSASSSGPEQPRPRGGMNPTRRAPSSKPSPAAQIEDAGAAARARLLPGRLRGRAGEPDDRDRGLRPAGAHAALVVRRALHPPARAPEHGALEDLRGDVPRRPVPRLPDGRQLAGREHAGHAHVLGPRRLRQAQPLFARFHDDGGRQHRRAGRGARASHPAGDRGGTAWSASRWCSTPRSRSSRTSTSTASCTARAIRNSSRRTCGNGARVPEAFRDRFRGAARRSRPCRRAARCARAIPPHPEYDLLWFIAQYAPELEQWERDIFLTVRAESLYFYPVFACQIMNEGWASYWHARLLREADFLPQPTCTCRRSRRTPTWCGPSPPASRPRCRSIPITSGSRMWEHIVETHGLASAHGRCARDEDDFGFIRNWLDRELAEKLGPVRLRGTARTARSESPRATWTRCARRSSRRNSTTARRASPPSRWTSTAASTLVHDYASDGRGLDVQRARSACSSTSRVSGAGRSRLHTVDERGVSHVVKARPN